MSREWIVKKKNSCTTSVLEQNLSYYIAKQESSQLSIFVSDTAGSNLFTHPQMGYPTGDIFC